MVVKNNCKHSTSPLNALVFCINLEAPLVPKFVTRFQKFHAPPLSGWQALCVENRCDVPSGSIYPVKTCHFGFFSIQRFVCGYAAFSLRKRECHAGVERKH